MGLIGIKSRMFSGVLVLDNKWDLWREGVRSREFKEGEVDIDFPLRKDQMYPWGGVINLFP